MAKKKQQKKSAKKTAKAHPSPRKKAAGNQRNSSAKRNRPRMKAKKQSNAPRGAERMAVMEGTTGGTNGTLGLDKATDIVSACAEGQDPETATVGEMGDTRIFAACIQEKLSDYKCPNIPLSDDTKLSDLIAV